MSHRGVYKIGARSIAVEHRAKLADDDTLRILKEYGLQLRQSTNAFNERGLAFLITQNNNHPELSEFLKFRLGDEAIFGRKPHRFIENAYTNYALFFPTEQLNQAIKEVMFFYKNYSKENKFFYDNFSILSQAHALIETYREEINGEIDKESKNSKDLPSKISKQKAAEELKSQTLKWMIQGIPEKESFADLTNKLQMEDPKVNAGIIMSFFNKTFRSPRMPKLLENLIKLDKHLIHIPPVDLGDQKSHSPKKT